MNQRGRIVSYVAVILFSLLTAFYTKPHSLSTKPSSNLTESSSLKKFRVCIGITIGRICIGIEITYEQEGVNYACNAAHGYCTVTVDEADVQYDAQTDTYYVNEEDVIDYTAGEFEEL